MAGQLIPFITAIAARGGRELMKQSRVRNPLDQIQSIMAERLPAGQEGNVVPFAERQQMPQSRLSPETSELLPGVGRSNQAPPNSMAGRQQAYQEKQQANVDVRGSKLSPEVQAKMRAAREQLSAKEVTPEWEESTRLMQGLRKQGLDPSAQRIDPHTGNLQQLIHTSDPAITHRIQTNPETGKTLVDIATDIPGRLDGPGIISLPYPDRVSALSDLNALFHPDNKGQLNFNILFQKAHEQTKSMDVPVPQDILR